MKLMTKLMMQMLIVILAVSVILGTGSYLVTSDSMQTQIKASVTTETRLRAEQIQLKLDALSGIGGVLSQSDSVTALLNGSQNTIQNKQAIMSYLSNVVKDNDPYIEMLLVVNRVGDVLLNHQSTQLSINVKERAYFQKLLETGETVISDVVISGASGNPVVVVATPVIANNQIIGAVLATASFDGIKEIIKSVKIGSHGYAYMFDHSGLVLSHKVESLEMVDNIIEIASRDDEFNQVVSSMLNEPSGDGMYSYGGIRKYVSYHQVGPWIIALTADESDYMAPVYRIRRMSFIIATIISVLSLMGTFVFTRLNIVRPLNQLKSAMALAGDGDLTQTINIRGRDEIAMATQAYIEMIDKQKLLLSDMRHTSEQLNQMAEELTASSEEVTATSEEISSSIATIGEFTENQVDAVKQANGALEQLTEGIYTSESFVKDALEASKSCTQEAITGRASLDQSLEGMSGIRRVTASTVSKLHELADEAKTVSSISETIKQIASQINLLALNASIEAARAGEHGRGFSVVAEEVRKLAEQTSHESEQITTSLSSIQHMVNDATTIVDKMQVQVNDGTRSIAGTQEALERVYNGVESMIALNESVLIANEGERSYVKAVEGHMHTLLNMATQIASSTQEINAGTQEQTAITESLSQVAEETSAMAEDMLSKMKRFKVK